MSTETSFTPGPWRQHWNGYFYDIRQDGNPYDLASINSAWDKDCGDGTQLGNAHLIAAAPELLEALQKMVKMASTGMVDFNPHDEFVMSSARAALAKARGES